MTKGVVIETLVENSDCEFSREKQTTCAVVSRDGFPDQRIALSKLQEALRLIVPMNQTAQKNDPPKANLSKPKTTERVQDGR